MTATLFNEVEFETFRDLFCDRTGIYFDTSKRYFVDNRLCARMHACATPSFTAYRHLLERPTNDPDCSSEWQALINALTINETCFFREANQFTCLTESLLPELMAMRVPTLAPIRIWSVPTATGEEAYSIAMTVANTASTSSVPLELLGSDINTDALATAAAGIYQGRTLRHVTAANLTRHFEAMDNERYRVGAAIKARVHFSQVNLLNPEEMARFQHVHVIFCRNVLIYFDMAARQRALQHLVAALAPGGFLCLGHAEHLEHPPTELTLRTFPAAAVYQKRR